MLGVVFLICIYDKKLFIFLTLGNTSLLFSLTFSGLFCLTTFKIPILIALPFIIWFKKIKLKNFSLNWKP